MIRPLRRRHVWIVRGLLALLILAGLVAATHPRADPRMDQLPQELSQGRQ